jgi:hypothetical protein
MELTKKQLIELVQFATCKTHGSFTWESEAEDTVDEYLKAINYTCYKSDSELLPSFLYKSHGGLYFGYRENTDVTQQWNEYLKTR